LPSEVDGRIMSEIYFWMKIGCEDLRERRSQTEFYLVRNRAPSFQKETFLPGKITFPGRLHGILLAVLNKN